MCIRDSIDGSWIALAAEAPTTRVADQAYLVGGQAEHAGDRQCRQAGRLHAAAYRDSVPEAVPLIVPHCFSNKNPEEIEEMVADSLDALIEGLTLDRKTEEALPQFDQIVRETAPEILSRGADLEEAVFRIFRAQQRVRRAGRRG